MGKPPTHYMYKDEAGEWQVGECEWYRRRNRWIDAWLSITAILFGLATIVLNAIN